MQKYIASLIYNCEQEETEIQTDLVKTLYEQAL